MENTVYADSSILIFFIEEDMMTHFIAQNTWLNDVISPFKEHRNNVQTLDSGIYLPIINDSLVF